MAIIEYFRSAYEIRTDAKGARAALDFLVRYDIPFHGLVSDGDGVTFRLYASYFREYERRRGERRFLGETRKRIGFIALLSRYKMRTGLLAGALAALLLFVASSLFVWDITVTGNKDIPESVVLDALEEYGMHIGAFIPKLDTEEIERRFILEVDGISFFTVNLRGTVARVELREREANTEIVDMQTPSNLVASMDGQIAAIEITGGVTKVKPLQIVKKGELLASGIIDSAALGYRLVRARGIVTARTTLTYEVQIPLETEEKVYTGETYTQKSVKFFSKIIKLFRNDSISGESCDRIEGERRIYLFGKIKLPIFIIETVYAPYEMKPRTLTEEEALEKATEELRRQQSETLTDAEILARHTSVVCDDSVLILTEKVECIINIAEEVKIGTE